MNVAYNMDCMDAMRKMPDKCSDLAVIDAPYGIGESGEKTRQEVKWQYRKITSPFMVLI